MEVSGDGSYGMAMLWTKKKNYIGCNIKEKFSKCQLFPSTREQLFHCMLEGAGGCSKVRKKRFKYCWHLHDSHGPVTSPVKLSFSIMIPFTISRAVVSSKEVKGGRALEQFLIGRPE